MTAFFANVQVRTDNRAAVIRAVEFLLQTAGYAPEVETYAGDRSIYVGPADNGWVGVYDSACDGVTVGPLAWLAQGLSARLAAPTLAWLVHDSALLLYLLFDRGEVLDRYISRPDYFPAAVRQARTGPVGPLGGDGARLLATAGIEGDGGRVTRWLRRPETFAHVTLRRVAATLGQPYAELGHGELEADLLAEAHLEDPAAFVRLEFRLVEPAAGHAGR